MVDLDLLKRTITAAPREGDAAIVTRAWLEEVEKNLLRLNAALAELSRIRNQRDAR